MYGFGVIRPLCAALYWAAIVQLYTNSKLNYQMPSEPLQTGLTPWPKFVASSALALTYQSLSPSCIILHHNIKDKTSTKRKESPALKYSKNLNYNERSLTGMFKFTCTLFCKGKSQKNGKAVEKFVSGIELNSSQ